MNDTEAIPIHESNYSPGFKVVSVLSGCFTFVVLLGPGMVNFADAPLETAQARSLAVFCLLSYLFLQFSCASHQRRHLHSTRSRVYLWLLGLFPLWSLPTAWLLLQTIFYVAKRA